MMVNRRSPQANPSRTFNWDAASPPLSYQGVTTRWTGAALNVPTRVGPEMVRKALEEPLPLESDIVELPLTVEFREGKKSIRDTGGQMEGVVDACLVCGLELGCVRTGADAVSQEPA